MNHISIKWSSMGCQYTKSFEGLLEAMEFVIRKNIARFEVQSCGGEWKNGQEMLNDLRGLFS